MNDRFTDPNWGKHGNPNNNSWYKYQRQYTLLDNRIPKKKKIMVSLWNLYLCIMSILLVTALIPNLREYVYSGIEFTEGWYNAVDDILDALNAPKVH